MSRIIFILVLLAVGYLLLKSWQRRKALGQIKNDKAKRAGHISDNQQQMVRCEYCNLHIPEHEAVKHGGRYACSLEHAHMLLNRSKTKDKD